MSGVTREMLLEYIQRKGGRVKNVDLVRHFRKHLLYDDPTKKDQAREVFKETVNSIAYIRQEEGEKFLYLKDEYKKNSPHSSPSKVASVPITSTEDSSHLMENSSYKANVSIPSKPIPTVHSSGIQKPPVHVPSPNVQKPIVPSSSVQKPSVPSPSVQKPLVPSAGIQKPTIPSSRGLTSPVHISHGPMSNLHASPVSVSSVPVSYNSESGVPTRLQNGGTYHDLEPEQKTVSPRHVPNKKPATAGDIGSPSRSNHNRFFQSKSHSPSHQAKLSSSPLSSPVFSRSAQPVAPLSTSFPTSSFTDYFQHGGHNHSPVHQSGGKGHKKMSLEISSPISVHSLSNGSAMAESSDLQQVMSDLENFGRTGVFHDSYLGSSVYAPSLSEPTSRRPAPPPPHPSFSSTSHTLSSENSSLSSNSMHSTSSPSSDQHGSPPVVKVTTAQSRGSQLGVQALIQQYTVPPGSVPSLSPERIGNSPSKAQRSSSSASAHSVISSDLQLRREPTPPDSKVQRSHSNVVRRSKGLDVRNSNLGTLTRESIRASGHHNLHRLSKNSDELVASNSKEELLSEEQDRESPIDEYVIEIDPMEREWMASLIDGNVDAIHHMLMSDSTYINKKGFLHGWTALHWAAKLGNAHLIEALMFSGGKVDIKSGSTPLHLAAEAGHYHIVEMLVNEYNAPVTARDYCGLRPVDVVDTWAPNNIKSVLRRGLPNRGLAPINGALVVPANGLGTLAARSSKQWGSVPQLSDREEKKGGSKNVKKGISFRRKKNYDVRKKGNRNSTISEHYENFEEP